MITFCAARNAMRANSRYRLKTQPDGLSKYPPMKADTLNPAELRAAGYKALAAALGPLGMARFLLQFERGHGDYTRQRHEWLRDTSVSTATARIRARKKNRA